MRHLFPTHKNAEIQIPYKGHYYKCTHVHNIIYITWHFMYIFLRQG